jgi:hypothetical protein
MDQIRGPRERHPSGKPIRKEKRSPCVDGFANRDGYKSVRLRADKTVNAIGFTANLISDDEVD